MTVTINERKEREREEMRELILNAANGIIKTEGIDGLPAGRSGRCRLQPLQRGREADP